MSTVISLKTREIIFNEQNGKCAICDRPFNLFKKTNDYQYDGDVMNIDHIYPKSLGGSNKRDNLRGLCYKCNTSRCNKVGMVAAQVIINSIEKMPIDLFSARMHDDLSTGIVNKKQLEEIKETIKSKLNDVILKIDGI